MSNAKRSHLRRSDSTTNDIYLPAVSLPPNFGVVEKTVTKFLRRHGRVLIPDTYNR
ncbi:hypothetical protein [Halomarina ordinaria]|uniref:Uncharacterized protein n=1 Tax=Halomarina ordinaria TaxID=3033939 RepID=A0ABD5UBY1_9EURY|nr:hypothetical protein [Halomarina sp. PSRA2]